MTAPISFNRALQNDNPVFSILIPTWNNLEYLKCCVSSIRKNSTYPHQIIVHVNEGTDGTLEWVKSQGLSYSHSADNVGVCYGFNAPSVLAQCDYIVLSDDDFYYAPEWDKVLLAEIRQQDHNYFCIAGTMIEHTATNNTCAIQPHNFGKTAREFDENKFLREFKAIPFQDWNGANWYPLVLHKSIWQLIGGLSVEFFPGFGSDPDMIMKLCHCGVHYFKGLSDSRVYHFGSRTTARIRITGNRGDDQFLIKWGLSKTTFFSWFLRMGTPYDGYREPERSGMTIRRWRDVMKRLAAFFKRTRA